MESLSALPRGSGGAGGTTSRLGRFRSAAVTMGETFRLSIDSLRAHKLRSFLTLLGVILAVTTLVAVMSVIAGLNMYVADRVANLGANVFIVDRFGIITSMDDFQKAQKRPLITFEDYERLRGTMQTARAVAAIDDRNVQTRSGDIKMENTDVMGASPNFADVRNINVTAGRFLTPADDEHRSEVVFIGSDLATKFFPNVDPIGKTIRAETHSYEVIGVAEPFGSAF
jgi:putative ABC transport system permease protein